MHHRDVRRRSSKCRRAQNEKNTGNSPAASSASEFTQCLQSPPGDCGIFRPHYVYQTAPRSGQVKRFSVVTDELGDGWEVRIEQDSTIVRSDAVCRLASRSERALLLIEQDVWELENLGWRADLMPQS